MLKKGLENVLLFHVQWVDKETRAQQIRRLNLLFISKLEEMLTSTLIYRTNPENYLTYSK